MANTPKPNIPKPSVPKPNIAPPSIGTTAEEPPVSAFEMGAMEQSAPTASPAMNDRPIEEEPLVATYDYVESNLSQRILGGVIDWAVVAIPCGILAQILPSFLGAAIWGLGIAYLLLRDALPFLDGQSIGKKLMKQRAVTEEGEPLTNNYKASVIRNVFFVAPILPLVEIFILNSREKTPQKGHRLGDDFAKTKVIPINSPEDGEESP